MCAADSDARQFAVLSDEEKEQQLAGTQKVFAHNVEQVLSCGDVIY